MPSMPLPKRGTPAHVQFQMGTELVNALEAIITKHGLKVEEASVPLLAGVLFGQAIRYGWSLGQLANYCLRAFEQMASDRNAQTSDRSHKG